MDQQSFAPQFLSVVLTNLTSSSKYYYTVGDDVSTSRPTPWRLPDKTHATCRLHVSVLVC